MLRHNKILIESSPTVEEANKVIEEQYGLKTIAEKTAFLKGMFDVETLDCHDADEKSAEISYWAMLRTIIY